MIFYCLLGTLACRTEEAKSCRCNFGFGFVSCGSRGHFGCVSGLNHSALIPAPDHDAERARWKSSTISSILTLKWLFTQGHKPCAWERKDHLWFMRLVPSSRIQQGWVGHRGLMRQKQTKKKTWLMRPKGNKALPERHQHPPAPQSGTQQSVRRRKQEPGQTNDEHAKSAPAEVALSIPEVLFHERTWKTPVIYITLYKRT